MIKQEFKFCPFCGKLPTEYWPLNQQEPKSSQCIPCDALFERQPSGDVFILSASEARELERMF